MNDLRKWYIANTLRGNKANRPVLELGKQESVTRNFNPVKESVHWTATTFKGWGATINVANVTGNVAPVTTQ